MHPRRLILALWGLAASTPALAQSITSGPTSVPVPVDNPLLLAVLAAALVLGGLAALRKHRVLAALLPAMAATLLLWQSPELRAQLLRAFSNPAGETLPIPVQQLPGGPSIPGFERVDFRNDSGVRLRILDLRLPTLGQCFPTGPVGLLPPSTSPGPSVACAERLELAPGATCRVDVDAHCRALAGARCYDHSVFPLFDVYYTGVPNDPTNMPRFSSDDGTCSGGALGPSSAYYIVVANSIAEADTLCPLTNVYTMAGWGFIGAPSNFYICTTLPQP